MGEVVQLGGVMQHLHCLLTQQTLTLGTARLCVCGTHTCIDASVAAADIACADCLAGAGDGIAPFLPHLMAGEDALHMLKAAHAMLKTAAVPFSPDQ